MGASLPESLKREVLIQDLPWLGSLRRKIHLAQGRGAVVDVLEERWEQRISASRKEVERRGQLVPPLDYPTELPILAHREEILAAIREHPVTIVAGETGSGKSTQLPKFCLEAGFGVRGLIGHTQPRRLAARTIATRLASELGTNLGGLVGYKIRFHDKTAPNTLIKLMTDGILLAETQSDRMLQQYEVLIIDEAHERSLNVDFLIGYTRRLLARRRDLRIIITSATIDIERFRDHYQLGPNPTPLVRVSGRSFPVEIRYRPPQVELGEREVDLFASIASAVRELAAIDHGHILVFLPTERDIREVARRLTGIMRGLPGGGDGEILPLYARLSEAEQQHIFQPFAGRRVVLATNVAESSLTVPGIKYVIDSGTARISRYSPRSKVQRLPIEAISQASANQRAGRCGRLAPGVCIRLYAKEDFEQRFPYTAPEIQRTNLAAVILRMKALELGGIDKFPFLDLPHPESIRDGYKTLIEIGALDSEKRLTPLGKRLSHWPVDPRIARIVLAGADEGCLPEILVIAAALEAQDPRDRPPDRQQAADERHARFRDPKSDFVSWLRLWDFYHDLKSQLSQSRLRKACAENFLSFIRMREWTEIHRQLQHAVESSRLMKRDSQPLDRPELLPSNQGDGNTLTPERYAAVHRALLAGFLSGIGMRSGEFEYTGTGGIKFHLWPGSGLFTTRPRWCLVAELLETSRRYGRTVGTIDPDWIEPLAGHLVSRSYNDPHWHFKRSTVMAFERVTLFGLPIVERRRVSYGRIDPEHAREIFIREGLRHDATSSLLDAEGRPKPNPEIALRAEEALAQVRDQANALPLPARRSDRMAMEPFYGHNEEVLRQGARLAAKYRKGEYFVDEYAVRGFYNARIPGGIFDLATLHAWLRTVSPLERDRLKMSLADFNNALEEEAEDRAFPDEIRIGDMVLPVRYEFAPHTESDGVTLTVPEDAIRQLKPGQTEWLVPGMVVEKIAALIRCLPKSLRTNFIPAPDIAKRIAAQLRFGEGDFFGQVIQKMNLISSDPIRATDFDLSKLPPYLRMNLRVIDADGKVNASGRDLVAIRAKMNTVPPPAAASGTITDWNRTGLTTWDWDEIPTLIYVLRGGIQVPLYPTLLDHGDRVSEVLANAPALAQQGLHSGTRRLLALRHRKMIRGQVSWLPTLNEMTIQASGLISSDRLREQIGDLLAERAFFSHATGVPRHRDAYEALHENAGEKIAEATQDVAAILPRILAAYHQVRLVMESCRSTCAKHALKDVEAQLQSLFPEGFLTETPWRWLGEYPRYLRGIAHRLERLSVSTAPKDLQATHEVEVFDRQWRRRKDEHLTAGILDAELTVFRWMVEEFRVSLFAQTLGTSLPVSSKRLEKQWEKVQ
jgi:ATP-dependent helicase HrpA